MSVRELIAELLTCTNIDQDISVVIISDNKAERNIYIHGVTKQGELYLEFKKARKKNDYG